MALYVYTCACARLGAMNPVVRIAVSGGTAPFQIVPLSPSHGDAAARLHVLGQPGTFLTSLGAEVLAVLYQVLAASPVGFGFTALEEAGNPLAFAAITTGTGRLFLEMGTRRLPALLPPLLRRLVQQPALIGRSLQTILYPLVTRETESGPEHIDAAELLAIMVDPAWRGRGLGSSLIEATVAGCRRRAIGHLDVTVDAGNDGARRFYERHGFTMRRQTRLYGRPMVLYRLAVQP